MTLRIVYVGNFLHPFCTEVHVTRDAERIPGVEVVRVQEPHHATAKFLHVIEAAARDADLLVYQRTWGLPSEAIDLWRTLEARGCMTASYHLDLYVGLERQKTIRDDNPFWQTGVVFTADGDPRTTTLLANMGIDHRWMPAACVSDECVPGTATDAWNERGRQPWVVFVGSSPKTYHPEWAWRATLLNGLAERYRDRFVQLPKDNVRLHGMALNDLYASVPVVVGDSLCPPGHTNYWSDRFYETVGRGGYLVGPNVPGIETQFFEGKHLSLYDIGEINQAFGLIDYALAHRDETREVAAAGQAHVKAHHTYRHRVQAILDSLGLQP